MRIVILMSLTALAALAQSAGDFPEASITNRIIKAKLYLPDPDKGYYRGTRFDWSGQISSLEFKGHQYFGQWFPKYDPKLHDSIMGPVEEFRSLEGGPPGYAEAKTGETFVRIGVGAVRKPDETTYHQFNTYEIADSGKWTTRTGPSWIEFTHELKDTNGYAYVYKKTVRLTAGKAEMTLEHSLRNTGQKSLDTSVYDHNFFVIDDQVTGPDTAIDFPFEAKPDKDFKGMARLDAKELQYTAPLEKGQSVAADISGFGTTSSDYDFKIVNRKSGAGVRIRGDRPLEKVYFWSIRTVACPEPYIHIHADPGQETAWKYTYDFYTMK